MPQLNQVCTAVLVALFSAPAPANTEYKDSVPIGFAEGLLIGPDFGKPTFYSDIVDGFPLLDFPKQFDLLGSADLVFVTRAIFQSSLGVADSRQALADQLGSSNFALVPGLRDPSESLGFVPLEATVLPLEFCHDDFGSLAARFRGSGVGSIVTVDHSLTSPSNSALCSDYIEQRLERVSALEARESNDLKSYQPRMVLPQPLSGGRMSYGQGVSHSSGGSHAESTTMLVTDWSMEHIFKHFADQISAQGWVLRTQSVTSERASGEWENAPEAPLSLTGIFSIQKVSESEHRLMFRMDRNLYIQNSGPGAPILIPNNGG